MRSASARRSASSSSRARAARRCRCSHRPTRGRMLIENDGSAVPLLAVSKEGMARWREGASAPEREWVAATGFAAEAGKLALIPGKKGGLGRILVGLDESEAAMWAFAG